MFVPINESIAFLTWLVGKSTPNPQSFFPVKSPLPKPSETTVKFLTPDYRIPLMRFMGMPHNPNPPARTVSPSFKPCKAYFGV